MTFRYLWIYNLSDPCSRMRPVQIWRHRALVLQAGMLYLPSSLSLTGWIMSGLAHRPVHVLCGCYCTLNRRSGLFHWKVIVIDRENMVGFLSKNNLWWWHSPARLGINFSLNNQCMQPSCYLNDHGFLLASFLFGLFNYILTVILL